MREGEGFEQGSEGLHRPRALVSIASLGAIKKGSTDPIQRERQE